MGGIVISEQQSIRFRLSIPARVPHVTLSTCGEPNGIKENTHPKGITAPFAGGEPNEIKKIPPKVLPLFLLDLEKCGRRATRRSAICMSLTPFHSPRPIASSEDSSATTGAVRYLAPGYSRGLPLITSYEGAFGGFFSFSLSSWVCSWVFFLFP